MRDIAASLEWRARRGFIAAAAALALMLLGAAAAAATTAGSSAVLSGAGVGLGATGVAFALVLGAARLALALLLPTCAVAAALAGFGTEQLLPPLAPDIPETLFLPNLRWAAFLVVLGMVSVSAAVAVITVYVADGPRVPQRHRRWLDWLFIVVLAALAFAALLFLMRRYADA